jgi:hypothetical protein
MIGDIFSTCKLEGADVIPKRFYKTASDEMDSGHMDQALWAKVRAQHAINSETVQKAFYIQARAQELALRSLKGKAGDTNRRFWDGLLDGIGSGIRWSQTLFVWCVIGFIALLIVGFLYSVLTGAEKIFHAGAQTS